MNAAPPEYEVKSFPINPENIRRTLYAKHWDMIRDAEVFAPHKQAIDEILANAIESIETTGMAKGIRLFQVNSLFRPEIQIAL